MVEEVNEGHMPISSHLTMHLESYITLERIEMLKNWVYYKETNQQLINIKQEFYNN